MIDELKSILKLSPHIEGGYYSETYRSENIIPGKKLPERYSGDRCFSTAIYYMLTDDTFSAIHRIKSDELYHFYLGDPVEIVLLYPDGSGEIIVLGQDILNGMQPQVLITQGTWQGSRLKAGGKFALMGTTVAPGFDFSDFETGNREKLVTEYPDYKDLIMTLTRDTN